MLRDTNKESNLTTKDIAKLAGVSQSTVSRVLNDYQNVKEETRESLEVYENMDISRISWLEVWLENSEYWPYFG